MDSTDGLRNTGSCGRAVAGLRMVWNAIIDPPVPGGSAHPVYLFLPGSICCGLQRAMPFKVVKEGQQALITNQQGNSRVVVGPRRVRGAL